MAGILLLAWDEFKLWLRVMESKGVFISGYFLTFVHMGLSLGKGRGGAKI